MAEAEEEVDLVAVRRTTPRLPTSTTDTMVSADAAAATRNAMIRRMVGVAY